MNPTTLTDTSLKLLDLLPDSQQAAPAQEAEITRLKAVIDDLECREIQSVVQQTKGCIACAVRDATIAQEPSQEVPQAYLDWLATKSRSAGVGGNEAWNAGVEWQKQQATAEPAEEPGRAFYEAYCFAFDTRGDWDSLPTLAQQRYAFADAKLRTRSAAMSVRGWCEGCDPDNCQGCGPYAPDQTTQGPKGDGRYLTVTTSPSGEALLVSWQDDEHRILEVVWERKQATPKSVVGPVEWQARVNGVTNSDAWRRVTPTEAEPTVSQRVAYLSSLRREDGQPAYEVRALYSHGTTIPEPYAWHYTTSQGVTVWHLEPSAKLDADKDAAARWPDHHKCIPVYAEPITAPAVQEKSLVLKLPLSAEMLDAFQEGFAKQIKRRKSYAPAHKMSAEEAGLRAMITAAQAKVER